MDFSSTYSNLEQFGVTHPIAIGVCIGVIFLLLSIFHSQIGNMIKSLFVKILLHAKIFGKKLIDNIYRSAAKSYVSDIENKKIILGIVILILFILQSTVLIHSINTSLGMNQIGNMIVAKTILDTDYKTSEEAIKIQDNLKKGVFLNVKQGSTDYLEVSSYFLNFVAILPIFFLFLWMLLVNYDDLSTEILIVFKRNLIKISQFLDLKEKDRFINDFISIKNKEDYLKLYDNLQNIANQNNVTLLKSRFQ